ncbi:FAD-dependent monooxygenase [Myxococcota bacterium]|nr:FAD-dependent monooxygenase [Myxococcota bacterium]
MNLENSHVIVVGGATAGAATALLAARAGARVTLVEKVAEPRAVGAGIVLAENGLAVLDGLGLTPALARESTPLEALRVVDGEGHTLLAARSDPRAAGAVRDAPRFRVLRRSVLQRVLLDAVSAEPRIERRFGAEVVEAGADGRVLVRHDGGTTLVFGDLVVGADGVHSRVRSFGRFGVREAPPGIPYLRVMVAPGLAEDVEAWTSAGLFGSFAVPDGTYVYASAGAPRVARAMAARDLDALRAAWSDVYAPSTRILAGLTRFEELIVNRVLRVDAARWFDGRLVLAGDAAHAMAPNLGQGANSALVDAAVLVDELGRASSLDEALAAYDARRRPAVRRVADTASRLGRIAEATSPALRWARDHLLMPLASRLTGDGALATMMQEPPSVLHAIGRAPTSMVRAGLPAARADAHG